MARRRTAGVAWVFWPLISGCDCIWDIAGVSTTSSSGAPSAGQQAKQFYYTMTELEGHFNVSIKNRIHSSD